MHNPFLLILTLVCAIVGLGAKAQEATPVPSPLSLTDCRRLARNNYPAVKQYRLIDQSRDFTLSNAAKAWLPRVSASAGAYAFTDILDVNPLMKQMGVDMNNLTATASVTLQQTVYDGGRTSAQKSVATAQSEVQKRQLDVSMYVLDERVDNLFFGVLLLDAQLRQCDLLLNDFATSERTVESLVRNGLATQSDLDAISAEKLKTLQQKEAVIASRSAYLCMLGVFTGREFSDTDTLQRPAPVPAVSGQCGERPELSYYASLNNLVDMRRKQLQTNLLPTVALFGTGMGHTQVSSLVRNGVLAAGVSISWNVGALYTRRNDLRKLELERTMNDTQQATFLLNNRLQQEESAGAATSLRKQLAHDDEIVRLRENIRTTSESRVKAGTESVNELLRHILAVGMARTEKAQHEILLLKEMYNQKHINNEK